MLIKLRTLREYVSLVVERRMREADVSDGSKVPHGSKKHITDLETRISSLTTWRDKQKRGSEARANYSRLIARLKSELASARHAADRKKLKENYATDPDEEDVRRWEAMLHNKTSDVYLNRVIERGLAANSIEELDALRGEVERRQADHQTSSTLSRGFIDWFYARRAQELGVIVRPLK